MVLILAGCCFGLWWSSRKLKRVRKLSLNGSTESQQNHFNHWKINTIWFWRFAKSSFFIGGPFLLVLGFLNSLLYPPPKVNRSYNDLTGKFEQSYEEAQSSPIGFIFWIPFLVSLIGLMVFLIRSRKAVSTLEPKLRKSLKGKVSLSHDFPESTPQPSPIQQNPSEEQTESQVSSTTEDTPNLDLEFPSRDLAYLASEVEKDYQRRLNGTKDTCYQESEIGRAVKRAEPLHRAVFETVQSNPNLTLAEIGESSGLTEKTIKSIMNTMKARNRASLRKASENKALQSPVSIPNQRPTWRERIKCYEKPAAAALAILVIPSVYFQIKHNRWKEQTINLANEEGRVLVPGAESRTRYVYNPASWVFGQPSTYRFMRNMDVGSDRDTSNFRELTVTSYTRGEQQPNGYFYFFGKGRKTVASFLASEQSNFYRFHEGVRYWNYSKMSFSVIEDDDSHLAILDFMSFE